MTAANLRENDEKSMAVHPHIYPVRGELDIVLLKTSVSDMRSGSW